NGSSRQCAILLQLRAATASGAGRCAVVATAASSRAFRYVGEHRRGPELRLCRMGQPRTWHRPDGLAGPADFRAVDLLLDQGWDGTAIYSAHSRPNCAEPCRTAIAGCRR